MSLPAKKILKKACIGLGLILIISSFIGGFIAYFVSSYNPSTGVFYDGFGRVQYSTPWFVRFIFGQERMWAGWLWFFGDMVIFLGSYWNRLFVSHLWF